MFSDKYFALAKVNSKLAFAVKSLKSILNDDDNKLTTDELRGLLEVISEAQNELNTILNESDIEDDNII